MRNPTNQHDFVKKLSYTDKVKHIVSRRYGLVGHMFEEDYAVAAIPNGMKIRAKIIITEYVGIIKMDTDFDFSQISMLVEIVISATYFGNSRVVQLNLKQMMTLSKH